MIKINGNFQTAFVVEIDVDSFDDISDEKMTYEQSDELVGKAIQEKYGVIPQRIWVGREVK